MSNTADKLKKLKHPDMSAFEAFNKRQSKINQTIANFEKSQVTKRGK